MDRRERERLDGGQQLKAAAAAFIYIAKWPRSAEEWTRGGSILILIPTMDSKYEVIGLN